MHSVGAMVRFGSRLNRWLLFFVYFATGTGLPISICQAELPANRPQMDSDREAALISRIKGEIGEARCNRDSQCRTLPILKNACGTTEIWIAWSSAGESEEKIMSLGEELSNLQQFRHQRSGMQSTCVYYPDPGAACSQGRCVIRAKSGAD